LAANYGKPKGEQDELFTYDPSPVYEYKRKTVIAPQEKKVQI